MNGELAVVVRGCGRREKDERWEVILVVTKWLWMSKPKVLPLALPPQLLIFSEPCPPPLHIAPCTSPNAHHPVTLPDPTFP